MIALGWDNDAQGGFIPFDAGFVDDQGLGTCVLISLFTDRRATADDGLPPAERRGWVGDMLAEVEGDRIGSRLWLLKREKQTEETRARAEEYAAEALAWLLNDGLVAAIELEAAWVRPSVLGLRVTLDGGATVPPIVTTLTVA
ncbi:hypothetical protein GXW78_26865 [Roseomonas terrae]|uniref:Mu-like prophage protein gp46 n=1 Tax=Neoroseomonas terrae TaxID=424799 RepID=A0ABS5EQK4_9PROT|nr:phage GP46 family protein [Neoroseomonas terrae]MBR0653304.1 hypothetical protein [Neoroseomonas terrae]